MKPFKYVSPATLDKAIALHEAHTGNAKFVAGGTDVIVKIKEGWLAPDILISLKKIDSLTRLYKDEQTHTLHIGSMVTHRALETSAMIQQDYPVIHDAVSMIGSVQVRNVATIGGNLVNAVPSADGAIPLIVLDGIAKITGPLGEHSVPLIDFFLEPYKTVLAPGEILSSVTIPRLEPNTGSAYIKFGRRAAMELPLLGVGVLLSLDDHLKRCTKARIGLGVAAPTPMRAVEAEAFLVGKTVNEETLREAGRIAGEESKVRDSVRGKAWHRKAMVNVQVRRMGLRCLKIIRSGRHNNC